jgi:hypothetical protein
MAQDGGSDMTFVKQIGGAVALGAALLLGAGLCAPPAQAGYIVDLTQAGGNVVATGSGTLDLAGLTFLGSVTFPFGGLVFPVAGQIAVGSTPLSFDVYGGPATGPTSFGGGGETLASSGSGDNVGIAGPEEELFVPAGYTSGNPLLSSATWDGQTLASLGVTPGVYVWTWGPVAADDSFTLDALGTNHPHPDPPPSRGREYQ